MLGDEPLKQNLIDNSFSGRPNSAKKRLPKITSKSMHFSLDDWYLFIWLIPSFLRSLWGHSLHFASDFILIP